MVDRGVVFIDILRLGESCKARSRSLRNEVVLAEEEVLAPQIAPPVCRVEFVEFVASTVGHANDVVDRRRAIVERQRFAVERDLADLAHPAVPLKNRSRGVYVIAGRFLSRARTAAEASRSASRSRYLPGMRSPPIPERTEARASRS